MFRKNVSTNKKNNFAKISKNLDTDLKIILLAHQNNYIGNSSIMSNAAKSSATSLFYIIILIIQNLVKFLANSFPPCNSYVMFSYRAECSVLA